MHLVPHFPEQLKELSIEAMTDDIEPGSETTRGDSSQSLARLLDSIRATHARLPLDWQ
jgi:hypothetical protein